MNLTTVDYSDTTLWKDLGSTAETGAHNFITNLTSYLNDSLGLRTT